MRSFNVVFWLIKNLLVVWLLIQFWVNLSAVNVTAILIKQKQENVIISSYWAKQRYVKELWKINQKAPKTFNKRKTFYLCVLQNSRWQKWRCWNTIPASELGLGIANSILLSWYFVCHDWHLAPNQTHITQTSTE